MDFVRLEHKTEGTVLIRYMTIGIVTETPFGSRVYCFNGEKITDVEVQQTPSEILALIREVQNGTR